MIVMIYKWAMTSIANGLVTRGYSKVGTCWDQLSYQNWVVSGSGGPTSQHIPASKLCTPESLELRSGLLAAWLAEHPMARVFTSFHVFSRLRVEPRKASAGWSLSLEAAGPCAHVCSHLVSTWLNPWTLAAVSQRVNKFAMRMCNQS